MATLSKGQRVGLSALFFVAFTALAIAVGAWITESRMTSDFGQKFSLVDHRGDEITHKALRGQPTLLFFGFTNCPDICPTTVQEIEYWYDALGAEAAAVDLKAFFLTVDPERDTPEMLGTYLTYFGDRVTGISGDPEQVWSVARSYKAYFKKVPTGDGSDYSMDHSASVYVLDRRGDFLGSIPYGTSVDDAVTKLRGLLERA